MLPFCLLCVGVLSLSLSVWTVYIRLYCSTLHLSLLCGWQMPTVQLTPSFTWRLMRSLEMNLRLSWKNAVRNSDVEITFWYFEIFFLNFHDSWKVSHLLNPFFFRYIVIYVFNSFSFRGRSSCSGHPRKTQKTFEVMYRQSMVNVLCMF